MTEEENRGKSKAASKIDRRKARSEDDDNNTVIDESSKEPVKDYDDE